MAKYVVDVEVIRVETIVVNCHEDDIDAAVEKALDKNEIIYDDFEVIDFEEV